MAHRTDENGLTIKQEDFCQEYVICGVASDSYKSVYDTDKMAHRTIVRAACKLLANPKVEARVIALRKEMQNNIAIDRNTIANIYLDAMKSSKEKGDDKTAIKAGEALTKLLGLGEGDKLSISSDGGFSINIIKPSQSDDCKKDESDKN